MRNLLGATALAVAFGASAFAQIAAAPPSASGAPTLAATDAAELAWLARGDVGDVHVSDLIGANIYAAEIGETTIASRDAWESVGVVNDVLLTRDGDVRAVLVDVGTFLGIGGKTVAAPLDAVRYVAEGPEGDGFFIVILADRETLQGAPAYERPTIRAEEITMNTTNAATAAPFAHDGYARADNHALTAREIEKANVYGRGDDKIGSISSLVLTKEGQISNAIIDVGGFLGMGAHPVSMPFADLTVLRKTGGDDVRVYIDATKEKLKAMPRHDG